eukprot:sb/3472750/
MGENVPIRTHYLGHVTDYQPIRDQYFLIWSVPGTVMLVILDQQMLVLPSWMGSPSKDGFCSAITLPGCVHPPGVLSCRNPINLGIQHDVFQPNTNECLNDDLVLWPSVLKANGYKTHQIGKWHLGYFSGSEGYITHEVGSDYDFYECKVNQEPTESGNTDP